MANSGVARKRGSHFLTSRSRTYFWTSSSTAAGGRSSRSLPQPPPASMTCGGENRRQRIRQNISDTSMCYSPLIYSCVQVIHILGLSIHLWNTDVLIFVQINQLVNRMMDKCMNGQTDYRCVPCNTDVLTFVQINQLGNRMMDKCMNGQTDYRCVPCNTDVLTFVQINQLVNRMIDKCMNGCLDYSRNVWIIQCQ